MQSENAQSPILFTESGIFVLLREVQFSNAARPILVTVKPSGDVGGITISVSVQTPIPLTEQVPSLFKVY